MFASAGSVIGGSQMRFAYVCVGPRNGDEALGDSSRGDSSRGDGSRGDSSQDWLGVCRRISVRVERVAERGQWGDGGSALVELGACTEEEALAVVRWLLRELAGVGRRTRVGIATSAVLAQLVMLRAPQ